MSILLALQEIRTPFMDGLMGAITYLGEATLLLAVGLVVIWCVDKEWGYRLFFLGLFGAVFNQLLKALFLVPRPWVRDPALTAVEQALGKATGYSFPSGHTQGGAILFGGLAIWRRKRAITILAVLGTLLVGFSRMYLGVHTPLDVGVSLLTGLILVLAADCLFQRRGTDPRLMPVIGIAGILLAAITVAYLLLSPASDARVEEFDTQALHDSLSALGGMLGLLTIYMLDKRYIQFPTSAVWWAQALKCLIGLGLVLLTRLILRHPLEALFGGHAAANGVRYYLMAIVGGVVWPLSFRWFSTLGKHYSGNQQL